MPAVNKRFLQPGERIRVLVVDDSVVIRRLVTHALEQDPGARGGGVGGQRRHRTADGSRSSIPTFSRWTSRCPRWMAWKRCGAFGATILNCGSSCSARSPSAARPVTLEALTLGASDYVTKASNEGSLDRSMARLREELIPKIKQFFLLPGRSRPASAPEPAQVQVAPLPWRCKPVPQSTKVRPKVVAIGVSTGGPTALGAILPQLPAGFPLPILIVQHMPPLFTRFLAERLCSSCQLPVKEASQGDPVAAGKILIAPGDFHLKVAGNGSGAHVYLDQSPPQNSCRPAVDALFSSIGEAYGGAVIAVILTGMGQDGLRGAEILKAQGASILAQDEASSVVWGMPGAVVNAGLADCVLPLDQVVPEILRRVGRT